MEKEENNNLEIDALQVIEKLKLRIAEDSQKIAILEATIDIYAEKIKEMSKQIQMFNEVNN